MNESKELLEATVKGLEEKIGQLNMDLKDKQRELEDVSKPEMTEEMYGNLEEIVEEAIGNYDFSDSENYDIEYELDYDAKVSASSLEFNSAHELGEKISQLNMDLKDKQRELEDVSKPEMTEEMYGNLEGIVEEAIGNYDFSDSENYDIEYELNYDAKISASSLEFNSAHELGEEIMKGIEKAYKMTETEVTNATHVEKVI